MARPSPLKGSWARNSGNQPYTTATVWGTGINPVHSYYGEGPALRIYGRPGNQNVPSINAAGGGASQDVTFGPESWGYQEEDWAYLNPTDPIYYYQDDRPAWDEDATGPEGMSPSFPAAKVSTPALRSKTDGHPDWGQKSDRGLAWFRRQYQGANTYPVNQDGPIAAAPANSLPSEDVAVGWKNKWSGGPVAVAEESDASQYVIQTSDVQRFRSRNNRHAVARGTDDERYEIQSRVMPQRTRHYSGQDPDSSRAYDMFPYQQDVILRPFRFRQAGTGPEYYLEPNAEYGRTPILRNPPPDPTLGVTDDSELSSQDNEYGYTGEDYAYYG